MRVWLSRDLAVILESISLQREFIIEDAATKVKQCATSSVSGLCLSLHLVCKANNKYSRWSWFFLTCKSAIHDRQRYISYHIHYFNLNTPSLLSIIITLNPSNTHCERNWLTLMSLDASFIWLQWWWISIPLACSISLYDFLVTHPGFHLALHCFCTINDNTLGWGLNEANKILSLKRNKQTKIKIKKLKNQSQDPIQPHRQQISAEVVLTNKKNIQISKGLQVGKSAAAFGIKLISRLIFKVGIPVWQSLSHEYG